MQMNPRMCAQEIVDQSGLVDREVVGNDVDLVAPRLIDHDVAQEGDEHRRGVPCRRLSQSLATAGVEGCIERERAVTLVLKTVSFGPPRGERQHRVQSIQRVDRSLLVNAEHCGMLRRVQIEANDDVGLAFRARIVRCHVRVEPLRLQRMLASHARDHHVRGAKLLGELRGTPVSGPVSRFALDSPFQDARLQGWCERLGVLPRVTREQPRQPFSLKALAPLIDERIIAIEFLADLCPRIALPKQQDQPCPARIIRTTGLAVCSTTQFHAFQIRQGNRVHEHDYTTVSHVTVH